MNRILKRPMFRLGGSTEGITSGLDGPNINASRQGYDIGGTISDWSKKLKEWGFGGDLDIETAIDLGNAQKQEAINDAKKIDAETTAETNWPGPGAGNSENIIKSDEVISEYSGLPGGGAESTYVENDELNTGGVEREGTGIKSIDTKFEGGDTGALNYGDDIYNIAEAKKAIAAAKELSEGLYEKPKPGEPGSMSSMLMNFGLNLAAQPGGNLVGAIGKAGAPAFNKFQQARQASKLAEREMLQDTISDALRDQADMAVARIEGKYDLMKEGVGAGGSKFAFEATQKTMEHLQGKERTIDEAIKKLESRSVSLTDQEKIDLDNLKKDLEDNQELQRLITKDKNEDPIASLIAASIGAGGMEFELGDYIDYKANPKKWLAEYEKNREKKASGGRAGYQLGGEITEEVSETMVTDPAQTQDLTYNELRSRLPREISNDIVRLLTASKQALMDFANIHTQQDVDNFNQAYNVDLVLPQEG